MPTASTGSAATDQLRVQISPGVVMAVDSGGSIILEVGDPLVAVKRIDMPCMTEYEAAANRCLTEPGPLRVKVAPLLVMAGDGAGHLMLEAGQPQIGTVRAAMPPTAVFTSAAEQCRQYVADADDAWCAQRTAVLAERSRMDAL